MLQLALMPLRFGNEGQTWRFELHGTSRVSLAGGPSIKEQSQGKIRGYI